MGSEKKLFLVDGTYLLFRAFHSLPVSMAVTGAGYRDGKDKLIAMLEAGASTGREPEGIAQPTLDWLADPAHDRIPTNAVRGLASVLLKLIREQRPSHMGVAFDLPGRVHRDDHYERFAEKNPAYAGGLEGYKATRPETPPEIHAQFPLARIVCGRALGIPVLEAEGFEADDVIGTLAKRARAAGFSVRLVTADKDLFQLVEDDVLILNPHKTDPSQKNAYLLMDPKVVEKEFGVPPSQVVDVLALMGDSSDNIPGVPGIGEKGAKDLVRRFGSVEGCIEAAREEGKIERAAYRKGLLEHTALALFSKELATIREDAPISLNLDDVWTRAPDKAALREVFGLLAFGSLLREVEALDGGNAGAAAAQVAGADPSAAPSAEVPARATSDATEGAQAQAAPAAGRSPGAGTAALPSSGGAPSAPVSAAGESGAGGEERRGFPPGGPASPSRQGTGNRDLFSDTDPEGSGTDAAVEAPAGSAAAVSEALAMGGAGAADAERVAAEGPAETGDVGGARRAAVLASDNLSKYRIVLEPAELRALVPAMLQAPRVAVDTETTSTDPMRAELVGISIAWEPHKAIYIPVAHRYLGVPAQPSKAEVLGVLAPLLDDPKIVKTGQNVKYDIEILQRAGGSPAGFDFDTMIAAFILESDRMSYALGALAQEYLGDYKGSYTELVGKGAKQVTFDQVEIGRAALYSGRDADVTLRLGDVLAERLDTERLRGVFDTIDMPLIEVLASMEMSGVRIDLELLARISREMGEAIATIRADIYKLAGHEFNIDSPRQLSVVMFEELRLPPVSRTMKSGVSSTRDEDLEVLAERHPLPARVRDYRTLAKLRSTYVDALPVMVNPATGRVHTSFHPTGAATGRLSSSDPNLQNIPIRTTEGRRIRAAFVPEPGWTLLSADYSQVELRVMAHLSQDPELIATFHRGEDIHRHTAAKIFNVAYDEVTADQRRAAKTINFGILYGMGPQRLARDLDIRQTAAKELIASYFGRFPLIRQYIDRTIARAEQDGYVSTLFGRVRRFPNLGSTSRFQRQNAIRAAVNSTIQGTAADLMKIAMIRLHRRLREEGYRARILIQVHDELVLEAPPQEVEALKGLIRESMEKIPPFEVPLTVEIASGGNWLEAKP